MQHPIWSQLWVLINLHEGLAPQDELLWDEGTFRVYKLAASWQRCNSLGLLLLLQIWEKRSEKMCHGGTVN